MTVNVLCGGEEGNGGLRWNTTSGKTNQALARYHGLLLSAKHRKLEFAVLVHYVGCLFQAARRRTATLNC